MREDTPQWETRLSTAGENIEYIIPRESTAKEGTPQESTTFSVEEKIEYFSRMEMTHTQEHRRNYHCWKMATS